MAFSTYGGADLPYNPGFDRMLEGGAGVVPPAVDLRSVTPNSDMTKLFEAASPVSPTQVQPPAKPDRALLTAIKQDPSIGERLHAIAFAPGSALAWVKDYIDQQVVQAGRIGYEQSLTGMSASGKLPNEEEAAQLDALGKVVSAISMMGSDIPFYAAGGAMGGAAGSVVPGLGTAMGATVGAFAVPAFLRTMYIEKLKNGEVKNWADFQDRFMKAGSEAMKEAVIGIITGGAGKLAAAAVGKVGAEALLQSAGKAQLSQTLAKIPAEVIGMTVGSGAIHGQMPTIEDVTTNMAAVLGLHTMSHAAGVGGQKAGEAVARGKEWLFTSEGERMKQKLADQWANIAKTSWVSPEQFAQDLLTDPGMFHELLQADRDYIPLKYREELSQGLGRDPWVDPFNEGNSLKKPEDFKLPEGHKPIWEMTRHEVDTLLNNRDTNIMDPEVFHQYRLATGRQIILDLGTSDPQKIANIFKARLGMEEPVRIILKVMDPAIGGYIAVPEGMKRHELPKSWDIVINPAAMGTTKETMAATVRHELEHILDLRKGYEVPADKRGWVAEGETRQNGENLTEFFRRVGEPHHKLYDFFNTDYWHRSSIIDAIDRGEKVPEHVLKEYPDLQEYGKVDYDQKVAPYRYSRELSYLENIKRGKDYLMTEMVDDLWTAKKFMWDQGINPYDESMSTNFYKALRMVRGMGGKVQHLIDMGGYKLGNDAFGQGLVRDGSKGLRQIVKGIEDLKGFEKYWMYKHSLELEAWGKQSGLENVAGRWQYVEENAAKFQKHVEEIQQFTDSLLRQLVDSGLVSEEGYQAMKRYYPNYCPFVRFSDAMEQGGGKGSGTRITGDKPISAYKGSEKAIKNPWESMVEKVMSTVKAVELNEAKKTLLRMAAKYGLEDVEPVSGGRAIPLERLGGPKTLQEGFRHTEGMEGFVIRDPKTGRYGVVRLVAEEPPAIIKPEEVRGQAVDPWDNDYAHGGFPEETGRDYPQTKGKVAKAKAITPGEVKKYSGRDPFQQMGMPTDFPTEADPFQTHRKRDPWWRNFDMMVQSHLGGFLKPAESLKKAKVTLPEAKPGETIIEFKPEGEPSEYKVMPTRDLEGWEIIGKMREDAKLTTDKDYQTHLLDDIERLAEEVGKNVDEVTYKDYSLESAKMKVWHNGEQFEYHVPIPLLKMFDVVGKNHSVDNFILKVMTKGASLLRKGAILAPEFMVRNPLADMFTHAVFSRSDGVFSVIPVYSFFRGLGHAIYGKMHPELDTLYAQYLRSGAGQALLTSLDTFAKDTALYDEVSKTSVWNKVTSPKEWLSYGIEGLAKMSEYSELGSRLAEFEARTKELGKSENALKEAAYDSREATLDFSKGGATIRKVNLVSAFSMAAINSRVRIVEALKNRPFETIGRAFAYIAAPSLTLAFLNRVHEPQEEQDRVWNKGMAGLQLTPEEQDLFLRLKVQAAPAWQKQQFWLVPVGDSIVRIKKPHELGMIFGTLPENFLTWILHDPEVSPRMRQMALENMKSAAYSFVDIRGEMLPTMIKVGLEGHGLNTMMTGRRLIPAMMENRLPEDRYLESTSYAMRKFSGVLDGTFKTLPPAGDLFDGVFGGHDPITLENYVTGLGGGLVKIPLAAADAVAKMTDKRDVVEPSQHWTEWPVAKAFFLRNPSSQSQEIADFLDIHQQHVQAVGSAKLAMKQGDMYRYQDILESEQVAKADKIAQAMTKIRQQMQLEYYAKKPEGMDEEAFADYKRKRIDSHLYNLVGQARQGTAIYNQLDSAIMEAKRRQKQNQKQ